MQSYSPSQYPAYPILLGPGQLPESVAFWHNTPLPPEVSPPPLFAVSQQPTLGEQKKHRRTRSGCFTCRHRRIKCDEARPICERCRKGNRECVYPSPITKPFSRTSSKSRDKKNTSPDVEAAEEDGKEASGLEMIPDEDEPSEPALTSPVSCTVSKKQSVQSLRRSESRRELSETSPSSKTKSESPQSDWTFGSFPMSPPSNSARRQPLRDIAKLAETYHLPDDVRYFLSYHQENLSHHHYLMPFEGDEFFRGALVDLAMQYEPLLYAIVGFAAYNHTIQQPNGKLSHFLKFYNRSLSLLRKSLANRDSHTEAMLATILQLSTFEESIGDFVNLVDHHQAADALITEIFTPESATQHELHRHLLLWHSRFDLVAGLLSGSEAILGREWYVTVLEHDVEQARLYPDDLVKQIRLVNSHIRIFALDMASLHAKLSRNLIHMDQYMAEVERLSSIVAEMHRLLKQFDNSEEAIISRPAVPLQGPDDVLNTDLPLRFYTGSLFALNFTWANVASTELMFRYQTHLTIQQPSGPELQRLALQSCHLIESIMRWPDAEVGSVNAFHNRLPLIGMFLPRDQKHTMWVRRMLAQVESSGYIHAPKVRTSLAEVWQIPELNEWWVPNEDGCPPIIKEIRALTEERTTNPRDHFREDLRDMKSLFKRLSFDDNVSPTSSTTTSGMVSSPSPSQSPMSG
ncbi:hypothetical protein VTN49DRAFT_4213 [Thermomyces lanuginosus]|uniref:uncharacterized protein n=1 Tax=Thermomyces lanuginosus TaxID=5541 RepID=UPI00374217E3